MAACSIMVCLLLKSFKSIWLSDNQLLELWNLKTLVANFFLLFAGYPYFDLMGINNPLWYICILIQCYILYYLLVWFADKFYLNTNLLCIGVLLGCLGLWYLKWINDSSFRGITSFTIGMLLCKAGSLTAHLDSKKRYLVGMSCFVFGAASLALIVCGIDQGWVLRFLVWPVFVFGCSHFEMKEIPFISWMGKVSFEVYIWHYPLMVLIQLIGIVFDIQFRHSYLTMLLFLLFSWITGFLIEKYIEKPLHRRVRRFDICEA